MRPESALQRWTRLMPVVAAAWLLVACLLVLQLWPSLPRTTGQWVLLFLFGPPLYVLGEAVAEKVLSSERGYKNSPARFSFKRVLAGVARMLAVVVVFAGASWLLTKP